MKNKYLYSGLFILFIIFSFCIGINLSNKTFNKKVSQLYARKIIDDSYIRMYPNDTVFDVKLSFGFDGYVIKDKNNNVKNNSDILKTGDILTYNSKSYQIAVVGDVTSDGLIKYTDILKLYRYYINSISLTQVEIHAADVTGDGQIKYTDILKLYRYYIGLIPTLYDGETFTVQYYNTASNEYITKSVEAGKSLGTLPSATREGYTLSGWYTSSTGGTKVTSSTIPTNNVTYYSQWQVNQYTVSFDGNGGSNGTSITKNYNEQIGTLPTSSRTGYTFKGWYTSKTGGTKIESTSKIPSSNTTYYARWQVNQYTLTFNGNGGSNGPSITKNYDTQIGTLPASTRNYTVTFSPNGQGVNLNKAKETINYTLNGWYTSASGGNKITSTTMMPAQNTTYYAQWSPNGITLATANKSGFQCTWNTKADGTGTKYSSGQTGFITDKNITLYAMCERLYTASFNGNGGSNGTSITKVANAELGTLPTSTRTNTITYKENNSGATLSATSSKVTYDFLGWYTLSSGGSKISSTTKMPTDNVIYYAHWGSNSGTLATAVKGGYVCKWNTKADGTGIAYNSGQVDFSTDKDITLYADCDVYYIARFDGNGGSNGTALYVKPGEKLGDLPTSHRVHTITYDINGSGATIGSSVGSVSHTFDGWYTAKSGGTQITSNTIMPSNDIKYYAHWKAGSTTLTTISRKGHTCTWNTQKDGNGTDYESAKTGYSISEDTTLYAKCVPNIYKITYDANTGTGAPSQQLYIYSDSETLYLSSIVPTKTGYKFKGWKYGSTIYPVKGVYSRGNDFNATLVAQWEPITYKIAYHANGGDGSMSNQTMTYDKASNLTTNSFTIAGGHFKNWNTKADGTGTTYTNGQSVKNLSSTSGDVVNLYAIYEYEDSIHFIKSGSSDAILIQSEGKFGLIDASNPGSSSTIAPDYNSATNNGTKVKDYLTKLGVKHLDFIMASHDHSDHIGGIPELVDNSTFVNSDTVFIYKENFANVYPDEYPGEVTEGYYQYWYNDQYLNAAKTSMSNKGAKFLETSTHSGDGMTKLGATYTTNSDKYKQYITFTFGHYNLKIYNINLYTFYSDAHDPSGTYDGPDYLTTDENDNSLVTLITTNNNKKTLVMGDLNVQSRFEQWYGDLFGHIDVLKASHHGYHYSNSKGLIDATSPSYFIVPNTEEVEKGLKGTKTSTIASLTDTESDFGAARIYLKDLGTKVYKTGDMTDACVVKFTGTNISVNNANGTSLSAATEMNSDVPDGWHIWFDNTDAFEPKPIWIMIKDNTIVKNKFEHNNTYVPGTSSLNYYWFDSNGIWDGKTYHFNKSGTNYWFGDEDGDWYAKNEWLTLNGVQYYFKNDSYLATSEYVVDSSDSNKYHYVDGNGAYYDSEYYYWVEDDTGWYFRGSKSDNSGNYWFAKSQDIWIYKNGVETKYTFDADGYVE